MERVLSRKTVRNMIRKQTGNGGVNEVFTRMQLKKYGKVKMFQMWLASGNINKIDRIKELERKHGQTVNS